jgi:hypothetical protein
MEGPTPQLVQLQLPEHELPEQHVQSLQGAIVLEGK